MTDHTAALRDLAKFRESFVIAVGDKSPFAKQALKLADDAIAALAQPQQLAGPTEEPIAWLHKLICETGECVIHTFTWLEDSAPFGVPGEDFDATYQVITEPLYDKPQQPAGWRDIAEAWKTFALHQAVCAVCAESISFCFEGQSLWDTAQAAEETGAHPSQQEDDASDAARLDWMFGQECFVESVLTEDGQAYRVHWPDDGSWQTELFTTPRAAIDAARNSAGEGGKNG